MSTRPFREQPGTQLYVYGQNICINGVIAAHKLTEISHYRIYAAIMTVVGQHCINEGSKTTFNGIVAEASALGRIPKKHVHRIEHFRLRKWHSKDPVVCCLIKFLSQWPNNSIAVGKSLAEKILIALFKW